MPRKLGKVGRNVVDRNQRSKRNDLSRLIYALGIRHVGEKAARNPGAAPPDDGRPSSTAPVEALQTMPTSARSSRPRFGLSLTSRAIAR